MAALQRRSGSYPLLFQYDGKQQALTIGDVTLVEARQWKGKAEHLLMRLKQRLLEVPLGCTITDFILHDGKPPLLPNLTKSKNTTLDQLRAAYVKVFSNGAIEANTLAAAKIHLDHIESTFGKTFLLPALTRAKLQEHIDRRRKASISESSTSSRVTRPSSSDAATGIFCPKSPGRQLQGCSGDVALRWGPPSRPRGMLGSNPADSTQI